VTFDEYLVESKRFVTKERDSELHYQLGLREEVGEVCRLFRKETFFGKVYPLEKYIEELGDVLWNLAGIWRLENEFLNLEAERARWVEKLPELDYPILAGVWATARNDASVYHALRLTASFFGITVSLFAEANIAKLKAGLATWQKEAAAK
jgi:NTP pyrophosphatase (non-canonical NTP hydrolase)